jgi:sugar lactone lactonase YvrE
MALGKAGVSKAGQDTFLQPSACHATPDGNMLIADGHWPRPASTPQDGDRLVWVTRDGRFIKEYGRHGRNPGEFMGPHGLAFDSKGRLFVADRSNNRIQIFDKDMNVVDEWRHFGRPSNLWILRDDTLIVSDSESNRMIPGAADSPEGAAGVRNPGWKNGIRIGSAKDGSIKFFVEGTQPEGLAADESGNLFAGLTGGCDASRSGGCLQKFVKR